MNEKKGRERGPPLRRRGSRLVVRRQVPGTVDAAVTIPGGTHRAIIMYTISANIYTEGEEDAACVCLGGTEARHHPALRLEGPCARLRAIERGV